MNKLDDYTSRKFLLSVGILVVGTAIFAFTNKLTSVEWLALMGINGGGYGVLNLFDKWLNTKNGNVQQPGVPQ
jgi:hypothetical protein